MDRQIISMIYIEGQEYMRMNYSLYLVADVSRTERHSLEKSVEQAIIGGCTAIQLRDKNISDTLAGTDDEKWTICGSLCTVAGCL